MNEIQYQMELAAYAEKIALAELEQAKAAERVKELTYEKARFMMQWLVQMTKLAQAQQTVGITPPPPAPKS